MPPNALTAIVRAFPMLLHVFLARVCVGSANVASLYEVKAHSPLVFGMFLDYRNFFFTSNLLEKTNRSKARIAEWSIPYTIYPHGFDPSL